MCDQLKIGEYWCPACQKSERFIPATGTTYRPVLKLSACLKHAMRFIRKLGSRRSKKAGASGPPKCELEANQICGLSSVDESWYPAEKQALGNRREPKGPAELSTTHSCELRIELPSTSSRYYERQSSTPLIEELGILNPYYDPMEMDEPNVSSSVSSRSISPIEDDYDVVDTASSSPTLPCYTIESLPQALYGTAEDLAKSLTSPVALSAPILEFDSEPYQHIVVGAPDKVFAQAQQSILGSPIFLHPAEPLQPVVVQEALMMRTTFSDEKELYLEVHDETIGQQKASYSTHAYSSKDLIYQPTSVDGHQDERNNTEIQIQSQYEFVESVQRVSPMLYKRSIRNLRRDPMTHPVLSFIDHMPAQELVLERGLTTLRMLFNKSLPSEIMDIYAMLHVSYVFAIVVNQKDVVEVQKDLYADILNVCIFPDLMLPHPFIF